MTVARDDNRVPLPNIDDFNVLKINPAVFAGGTVNARGHDGGTSDPLTLATVTGDVLVRIFGVCTTDLAGATATLSVGVAGNAAVLIAQTTATDIDANEIWLGAAPAAVGVDALADVPGPFIVANGLDIIETVGTTSITAGALYYVVLWKPLTHGSSLVSAV